MTRLTRYPTNKKGVRHFSDKCHPLGSGSAIDVL